jgi:hypothetical protein
VVVLFSFFLVGSINKSSLATSLLTSFVGDHTIPNVVPRYRIGDVDLCFIMSRGLVGTRQCFGSP